MCGVVARVPALAGIYCGQVGRKPSLLGVSGISRISAIGEPAVAACGHIYGGQLRRLRRYILGDAGRGRSAKRGGAGGGVTPKRRRGRFCPRGFG